MVDREKLLIDMKLANQKVEGSLSNAQYREIGEFDSGAVVNEFGSWNKAKEEAGLEKNPEPKLN